MNSPGFSILMPVVRPPILLPYALDSVLHQTRDDFELLVIGDGAPPETIAAVVNASVQDPRIRCFPFTKGERHGEAHRHTVLREARGQYICGLADDDLWFPEHLEEMGNLLSEFEFGNLLHVNVTPENDLFLSFADLGDPTIRARMTAEVFNFFGPSNAGYRMETYCRMPVGWSPAPLDIPSDLAMWRRFLSLPGIVAGTRFVVTSLHFAASNRKAWSMERRREEIARYAASVASPTGRDHLRQQAFRGAAREYVARHQYMLALLNRLEATESKLVSNETATDIG